MTAICYSQLSGFRSPWGGAGGRCWQEAGWFTGPPPPPPLPTQRRLWAWLSPPSLPLFIPPFSPTSFSMYSMSIPLSPLSSSTPLLLTHLYVFSSPLLSLYSRTFLLYLEAIVPLRTENEGEEVWLKSSQKKVLHRNALIVIDTQLMEAIKEL